MWVIWVLLIFKLVAAVDSSNTAGKHGRNGSKPHILLIVADDLGWNDVSWHNPAAVTPNLHELAHGGVILNQSYVLPICTPTRSALLTGRYPFTIGRQRSTLRPSEPTGLTLNATLLPQALKKAGYSTHAVGKWHLGFCSWSYTPTYRGFDTFYGYYNGAEDYYTHIRGNLFEPDDGNDSSPDGVNDKASHGLDLRNNTEPDRSKKGIYSSYVFASYIEDLLESRDPSKPMFLYLPFQNVHAPLMVPENYTKPYRHIRDDNRRTYLGMVTALDEAVGRVVKALKKTGHYDNSVIVFTTDNGGTCKHGGNNWPLRGMKATFWEGGTRGSAFVHSPLLPNPGTVSNELLHATDWFKTLATMGGGETPDDTDGFDQWGAITGNSPSHREKMVYNIDLTEKIRAAVRIGDYKLIVGFPGEGDWTPPPELITNADQEYVATHIKTDKILPSANKILIPAKKGKEQTPSIAVKFLKTSTNKQLPRSANGIRSFMQDDELPPLASVARRNVSLHGGNPFNISKRKDSDERYDGDYIIPETNEPGFISIGKERFQDEDFIQNNDFTTWEILQNSIVISDNVWFSEHVVGLQILRNKTEFRLYNVKDDPEERVNLAEQKVNKLKVLLEYLLGEIYTRYIPADIKPQVPEANPKHWNGTWSPGWCNPV